MKKTFILLSMMAGSLLASTAFGQIVFQGLNPGPAQGFYGFAGVDTWGADMTDPANAVTGLGILVDDGTAADSLGCNALVNSAAVSGKIAFIYRGSCEFGTKALKAQNAGAIAAVIINNQPGTMSMGVGAEGGSVTIPVVMISQETGILLKPYLEAGTLEIFYGSKLGVFANDLGVRIGDIVRPLNYATPSLLAQDTSEFKVLVGGKVRNYGTATQLNVSMNAKVTINGSTQLYDETVTIDSIPALDSAFFELPTFFLPNGDAAKYTLAYQISSDAVDQEVSDNTISQDFYITDGVYSKSRYDFSANEPIKTGGYTSSSGSAIKWGVLLNAVKGSRVKVNAVQFAGTTNTPDVLTGQLLSLYLYEWDDADQNGGIIDEELTELAVGFYTYESDLQNEYVLIPFTDDPTQGVALADDKVYYIALDYQGTVNLFFPADEGVLDYDQTINFYEESINPLFNTSTGQWFGGGFGSDLPLAISVLTAVNDVAIEENIAETLTLKAYPNPATDIVNITFGNALANAEVKVDVIDVTGRMVSKEQFNLSNAANYVSMNTTNLANGSYFFKVSVNGQVVKSLPVVISK